MLSAKPGSRFGTQMPSAYAKFRPNRRGAASGDLLRKLGFASGNLIASRQAHSDGALWKFRFVERPYAAARFGRRFVILPLQNAGGAFLDCGVAAQKGRNFHSAASECACREAIRLPEAKPSLRSKSQEAAPRKFRPILRMT